MKQTRDKIIEAAKELFEKNGYAATTTREIADLAGVSEVTLFRHFDTKRNLFEQTIHSCMHPYELKEYLQNNITYDLEKDLTHIAYNMMKTYQQNMPLLKMIFKDKMKGSISKMHMRNKEHDAKNALIEYFHVMKQLGKINANPEMAFKFFITNISGFFMKDLFLCEKIKIDKEYFAWMIQKVIAVLHA